MKMMLIKKSFSWLNPPLRFVCRILLPRIRFVDKHFPLFSVYLDASALEQHFPHSFATHVCESIPMSATRSFRRTIKRRQVVQEIIIIYCPWRAVRVSLLLKSESFAREALDRKSVTSDAAQFRMHDGDGWYSTAFRHDWTQSALLPTKLHVQVIRSS
jgi:hypothetical protein